VEISNDCPKCGEEVLVELENKQEVTVTHPCDAILTVQLDFGYHSPVKVWWDNE
jgi:hypothetical protein